MNRKLLLWGMIPLLGLVLSEVLLRVADPPALQFYRRSKMVHAYHPEYFISLRPSASEYLAHPSGLWQGQFTVNSYGMRDLEEPEPGRPKMLCLGDSLAMGYGVADGFNFCHLLKEKAGPVQVLNASVDGFGTYAYALRAEELVSQIDGVQSILLFPSPTDWWIPDRFRERGILPDDEKDLMRRDDVAYRRLFRLQFLATEWSYTLQALKLAQEQLKLRGATTVNDIRNFTDMLLTQSAAELGRRALAFMQSGFLMERASSCGTSRQMAISCPEPLPDGLQCSDRPPEYRPMHEFTVQNLNRLISLSRSKGIRLVVVLLPMQEEEIRCAAHGLYHENGLYAVQARHFFKQKGIDVIDLMPFTKSMCSPGGPAEKPRRIQDYFLAGDGHLTVAGNHWAADALAAELRRLHLFPELR